MLDRLGVECVSTRIYREVVEPERPAFTNNALDPQGTLLLDGCTTVIFAEQNGKTKLTLETMGIGRVSCVAQMLAGMEADGPSPGPSGCFVGQLLSCMYTLTVQ